MQASFFRFLFILLFLFCLVSCIALNLDVNILKALNPDVPNSPVWQGFSSSVSAVVIGLPVGMYLISHFQHSAKGKQNVLHIAGSIIIAMILTQTIKYTINRDRPFIAYPLDIHPFDNSEHGLSFPSQHTSFAFATATIVSMYYKKWWVFVAVFGWASMVGYSRLYLGQHYPSDVIAGAGLGAGSAFLSEWLNKKIWPARA